LRGRGAKGAGPGDLRDPGPAPVALVGTRSGGDAGVGRKKALCREWLTRGVRVAAAAGGADGRTGVSGVRGRLAGPVVRSRGLGRPARDAGLVSGPSRESRLRGFSSFLFFFYFIFLLLYLNSNLIWSLNSNLVYLIHWIFRYEAHNTLLYILGTLFSYFV